MRNLPSFSFFFYNTYRRGVLFLGERSSLFFFNVRKERGTLIAFGGGRYSLSLSLSFLLFSPTDLGEYVATGGTREPKTKQKEKQKNEGNEY
jgi:hypothetical protein